MVDRPKVLCLTSLKLVPETLEWLRREVDLDYRPGQPDDLHEIIGGYDAFWGHTDVPLDEEFFERGVRLKAINTASTGTNHIDVKAAAGTVFGC